MARSNNISVGFVIFLCLYFRPLAFSEEPTAEKEAPIVGQIFESPVPVNNYYFVKRTLMVFGNKWGPQPKTQEELEDVIWEQLVLSYEAFRRNSAVTKQERDAEIARVLQEEKAAFDWKKDKDAYTKWVKEKTGEEAELFENQINHLLQLKKLRDEVMNSFTPAVSEEESHEAFLDEQDSIELELAQFDTKEAADEFHNKVLKDSKFWDEQKGKAPNNFRRPGLVTLIFLIDIWKIPRDDLYKMLKMGIGNIYQAAPIYKGYGVFKVLAKRLADEAAYTKLKYSYHDKVAAMKKYEGLNEWIKKLKQDANIKIYRKGG